MNQSVEVNASKALNAGNGNARIWGFGTRRTTVEGRPIEKDQSRMPPADVDPVYPTAAAPMKRKVVHYFLDRGEANQLEKCDNAWVPPSRQRTKDSKDGQPMHEEDAQTAEILKKIRSILNKITTENMALLADDIMSLPINTEKRIKEVIDLLFQKAIDEPKFTPLYAYVCTALHNRKVEPNDKKSKTSFKNLLTKCCQDRFYKMQEHEDTMTKNLRAINDCMDQDTKNQLQSKHNQDDMDYRRRSVGNCRFMSELYKVGILTCKTLETSMKYLLKSPNEETLECACNILKHTGKTLSHKATFKKLEEYTSAAYRTKIPTRIRFMIESTIDLKNNNWVPRNARSTTEPAVIQRAPRSTEKPVMNTEYKPLRHVPTAPVVFSRENTRKIPDKQTLDKLPTVVPKDDVSQTNELANMSNTRKLSDCKNVEPEEIEKKFLSILDDQNPESMVMTAEKMISLPVKTENCLKKFVEIIFQKAMDEPALIPQLAHISSVMKNIEVQSNDQKSKTSFRILLIAMCQNAFESMSTRKRDVVKDRLNIEACKDKQTRKELQSRFDQNEIDHRRRSVANIRFMSELLKVKVLVPPILENCAEKLVESPKESSMDCLHVILIHAGNTLYLNDALGKLNVYVTSREQKIPPTLRAKILEVLQENSGMMLPNTCEIMPPPLDDTVDQNKRTESTVADVEKPPAADEQPPPVMPSSSIPESVPPKSNVYNTVKSIVGSVTAENLSSTINELSAHIMNVDGMEKTVELIFARANVRSSIIPELVRVCSSLKNIVADAENGHAKPISFKKQIMAHCIHVLRSGVDSSVNGFSHKEPYAFVGELFNANVLSAHTILEFLQIIPDKLTNRGLDNTCCLLKAAGKKLEQVHNLKKTIRKLTNMVSNDAEGIYSQRSSTLLKELVELRVKKWVP